MGPGGYTGAVGGTGALWEPLALRADPQGVIGASGSDAEPQDRGSVGSSSRLLGIVGVHK